MPRKRSLGLLLAVLAGASTAAADPLAITMTGELPFSHDQLAAALSARVKLATVANARRIEAHITGDASEVRIAVGGRTRAVALAGASGADAARLVAFSILDVAGDQLDPPRGTADAPPAIREVSPATPSPGGEPWTCALWAIAGTHDAGALEVAVPVAGRVRIVGSAGVALATTDRAMGREAEIRSFPARLEVATRLGALELRAGAVATVERAAAARSSLDVLAGAGGGVVYRIPLTGGFALLAGGGGDVFANRLEYRVGGVPVATTGRLAWWAGAALAKEARW